VKGRKVNDKKGSKAPGMAKPKETQNPMEDKKTQKLNMVSIFII